MGEKGFVIAFPVKHRDRPHRHLRLPFLDHLNDPLFHLAFAFVDDKIDDSAGMIAGDLTGPPRHRHSTLGVVAVVHLLFAGIGQQVPVGEPDIVTDQTRTDLQSKVVVEHRPGQALLGYFVEPRPERALGGDGAQSKH